GESAFNGPGSGGFGGGGGGAYIRPYLETTFRRELTDGKTTTELQFVNVPDSDFTVDGIPIPGNTFVGRRGVTIRRGSGSGPSSTRFARHRASRGRPR
ncbi:MAG: hypothetical protein LC804_06095, partial [Acidobacteria bacterium]|nr:hypothetical protein [Acidobacteriota bacterium]